MAASTVRSIFGPFVELVKTWNLPDWLVHWGHPGNMVSSFSMTIYLHLDSLSEKWLTIS